MSLEGIDKLNDVALLKHPIIDLAYDTVFVSELNTWEQVYDNIR